VKNTSSWKQFEWLTKKKIMLFGKQQEILHIYIYIYIYIYIDICMYLEAIKFHLQVMQYDGNKNIYIFHFQLIVLNYLTLVTVVCT